MNAKKLEEADDIVQLAKPTMEMRKLLQAERMKGGKKKKKIIAVLI